MADFLYGLNTSTIQPAGLMDKIRITGQAGYDAIEPWIADIEQFLADDKGTVADVAAALDDQGLRRPSMIALRGWCVADQKEYDAALETFRRQLDIAGQLGIERIVASPPRDDVPQSLAIDRYSHLLEFSSDRGVPASVEFLGFVAGINTLDKAWAVCAGSGNGEATVTPDIWHMFRGNSADETLDEIPADHISCFHWNDAPAAPPREQQTDADRVMPGDGIVDLKKIVAKLRAKQWSGCLSLELFNRGYWQQDPLQVAKTGLAKMKQSTA